MSKVISIDLELNPDSKGKPTKIIQLGYVIGDVRNERIFCERSLIINPHEDLGFIQDGRSITDLTGITQEMVDNGMSLQEAYEIMCGDIKRWNPTVTAVQWGTGDSRALRQELGLSIEDYIFRMREFDAKTLYQVYRLFNNEGVAAGLENAMKSLGMEFIGRPHDAKDDALNTFRIFYKLGKMLVFADKVRKLL